MTAKQPMAERPLWLVLAVGNPGRGDDALGPLLIERLCAAERGGDVEFLTDFQLQVEHALDVEGRRGVLFVDAAGAAYDTGNGASVSLRPIAPDARVWPASHALRAQAVLQVVRTLGARVPAAWQLAIEGRSFTLGEGLSPAAERHLDEALALAREWLLDRRATTELVRDA